SPTGTVTFLDGSRLLGTVNLFGGEATLTTPPLSAGQHGFFARYSGDTNFRGNSSATTTLSVNKGSAVTALFTSSNPAVSGEPVILTASVQPVPPATGIATGAVTFLDGQVVLATTGLTANGDAVYIASDLRVGTHDISAQYGGDDNLSGSTSPLLQQTITPSSPTARM